MSTIESATSILTESQRARWQDAVARTLDQPDFASYVESRHQVSEDFRRVLEESGLLSGRVLGRDGLAEIIRLQWKVQNLNAVSLPQLLGTYTYYRQFKGFEGNESDFARHMSESRPAWTEGSTGHPGVDLEKFSRNLRALLSEPEKDLPRALEAILSHRGVGRAFGTGLLFLFHPDREPLVNNAARAPFRQAGPFKLERTQARSLGEVAARHFGAAAQGVARSTIRLLGWRLLLQELKQTAKLEDFFQLDQVLWRLQDAAREADGRIRQPKGASSPADRSSTADSAALLEGVESFVAAIEPERVRVRKESEDEARRIVAENLGHLTEDQLREVFRLFNTDLSRGKKQYTRFLPAFTGRHVNEAVGVLDITNRWIERLWKAAPEEVGGLLEEFWESNEIPSGGQSFPTGILYLRDPGKYNVLLPVMAKGYARLSGWKRPRSRSGRKYMAYNEGVNALKESLGIPPQVVDAVLWKAERLGDEGKAAAKGTATSVASREFTGFSPEAFEFMAQLEANNREDWFQPRRGEFRSKIREPMRRLVADLGPAFVQRVNPDLEHEPKSPNTLSSIRKNIFGRKEVGAYWPHFWGAFHRRDRKKTEDFQLFLSLRRDAFTYGLYFASAPPSELARLLQRLVEFREEADQAIRETRDLGVVLRQVGDDRAVMTVEVADAIGLVEALKETSALSVTKVLDPSDPLLRSPDLVDDIDRVFTALYPLWILATSEQPREDLDAYRGLAADSPDEETEDEEEAYTREKLEEECFLDTDRVDNLVDLLLDKRQIIFYGPPGTGKTWLAERFASYWAGSGGAVKTIQFHPSYGYEDFVEGFRPHLDDASGQVTYKVVPGVFRRFCERARAHPKQRFVLVIDEINRGNLPRIFGELLYLLERRGQAVELPVSGESFRVPMNLFLIGTMNTADQSIALLDMALRRRFHFERFDPDPDLLRSWLALHRPEMEGVADVLGRLNARLAQEGIDKDRLIGHSHFMHAELDDERLERIWAHSVRPTIEEFFYGRSDRQDRFTFEELAGKGVAVDDDSDEEADEDENGSEGTGGDDTH